MWVDVADVLALGAKMRDTGALPIRPQRADRRSAASGGPANVAKVTMPQLGESVAEGTIGKWLKQPGDHVDKYEPLVEVITDKVNAEVPSPFEGILREILVEEGATVPNNAEIAVIETADDANGTADDRRSLRRPRRPRLRKAAGARRRSAGGFAAPAAPALPAVTSAGRPTWPRQPPRRSPPRRPPRPLRRRRRRPHDPGGPAPPPRARADRRADRRDRRRRTDHPRGRPQGRRVDPHRCARPGGSRTPAPGQAATGDRAGHAGPRRGPPPPSPAPAAGHARRVPRRRRRGPGAR